jgi:DNA-binding NarL/FixJ family response regulator
MSVIRILIADDQPVVRLGFSAMCAAQPDMEVVATAGEGREAVRLAASQPVDVALMDIRMPVLNGIDATRQLQKLPAAPHVLVLTTFDLDEYVYEALRAGASGFLLKDAAPAQILEAIRVVAAGDALLAPQVTRRLIAEFATRVRLSPPPELSALTPREGEVFRLLARGLTNVEIAARLHLAEQTVKSHVSAILMKLGLRDRVQAVVLAYESGLVVPGDAPLA